MKLRHLRTTPHIRLGQSAARYAAGRRRTVIAWHRFGPYHHARCRAAAQPLALVGLEISTVDKTNAWALMRNTDGFEKITLCPSEDADHLPATVLRARMDETLRWMNPEVVAVHGYASRNALALLASARRVGSHVILMSESNAFDEPRVRWKERLKRRLVSLFDAGLAGGTTSKAYLEQLGMPSELVFIGYDAVDNAHFARASIAPKPHYPGLQRPFFLASARFIDKKNLVRLVDAYAVYCSHAWDNAWQLVILGDGHLRPTIESKLASLQLCSNVLLPGFKQYEELPAWYGVASCFIHPSTTEQWGLVVNEAMAAGLPVLVSNRCGCARDLVREGVNGFTFDPHDVQRMADLMVQIAHGDVDRTAMGRASGEIIANWGPERFADGLEKAVGAALQFGPKRLGVLDRALLWALMRR